MISKLFVLTDNLLLYKAIRVILSSRKVEVDYFHSPKSYKLFELEDEVSELDLKDNKAMRMLMNSGYELGFSCHSKQIFPSKLVNQLKCINIHPGFNPYNRGWFPQVFSIINKKPIGATIHIMDEEIDHGKIIAQREVVQSEDDTSLSLYNKVVSVEMKLLEENIDNILNNACIADKPKNEGNYNSIQDFQNLCAINLEKQVTMQEAIDYLRAMSHYPYKNAYFVNEKGKRIYVSLDLQEEL